MRKINFPKLQLHRPEPKKLAIRIIIAIACLAVLAIIVYGFGIYKYHWSRYGTKTVVKIVPYPAGFVGPVWISVSEFEFQKSFILHFYEKTGTPLDDEAALNRQIMDRLVEQSMVDKELRKQGIKISPKDIDNEYQTIITNNQGEENTKNMLSELYGISLKDFKSLIRDKLEVEKFRNELLTSAHLQMILVKDESRASDVLNQLKAGGDFAELAKKFSEDEISRDKGGDVGFISRGGMIFDKPMTSDLEQAIFNLKENELPATPIKTDFGFLVIKVSEKKGKIDKSYTDWISETKNHSKILRFVGK
jgi:foldase protein PrsA